MHSQPSRYSLTGVTALLIFVAGCVLPSTSFGDVTVEQLCCEYRENPLGIDATQPRLSWILKSDERDTQQSAYQVLVASDAMELAEDAADLWDSGRVESDQSIQVRYDGKPLDSRDECYWKVRVWDQHGNASEWSEPARWTMGILRSEDWNDAQWIGKDGVYKEVYLRGPNWIWYPENNPAEAVPPENRYFRRVFELPADRRVVRAEYLATADDQCKAYINGRDIGGRDNYRTVKQSDLTHDLHPGRNLIAILGMNKGEQPNPAAVVGILTIEFDRGEPMVLITDGQWLASKTESPGWNTEVEFDDSDWVAAQVVGPAGIEPWGDVRAPEDRRLSARWLRKEFDVDKDVRRATVSFSGLGLSELYINGEKVGDHVLSPGATQYPERVYYVTYDVTDRLGDGENAMGVVLGNGRYYSMRSRVYAGMPHYGFPKLLLNLRIEHTDGTVSEVVSDASWMLTDDGPILANNEYDGEEYDARKEFDGWSEVGFDDTAWQPVDLVPPAEGALAAEMIEPIRVTETLKPIAITEPKPGVYIVDMGQNMVGWCRLKVSGPAGTTVTLRHAETLKPDGTLYLANIRGALVTDKYTLKGEGTEMWEPRFTYHGFRYVEITGDPGVVVRGSPVADPPRRDPARRGRPSVGTVARSGDRPQQGGDRPQQMPTLDSIEGRVVHDDLRPVGEFECSNPLLNQIYENIVWGLRGNYRSLPTDCPQRDERQGWLGDRSEEPKGETYIFDIAALYSKWLQDMEDSQKPSGSVPDVCPAHWPFYSDNVTWPSTTVITPNMLRRQYADERIIARHYDSAKKWVDYMAQFIKEDGTIDRDSYGDWCVPPEDPTFIHSRDPARKTADGVLATSYFYHDNRLMAKYARMLGKESDAEAFDQRADALADAFNEKYLKREEGQYDNGTQTSCVLSLHFGLVPEDMEEKIFNHLVQNITEVTDSHIGTGLIGGQFLNQVLSNHGRADLSYTIASQEDYPSWGYMIANDATTIWELWNGNTADPTMNSHNHVMLVGDLVVWFYEYLAGIAPDDENPGFKHIVMRPHPVGDLEFVKASFDSPHGLIASHWQHKGDTFDWQITVPAGTTATVYVPADHADDVTTESGTRASEADGVEFVEIDGDRAVFRVGSGDYHFVSQ